MSVAAASSGRADLQIVRPFIQATIETLKVQCSLDITHKDPYLRGEGVDLPKDYAAVFSVFSRGANVAVCMGFQKAVYEGIMSKMLSNFDNAKHSLDDGLKELVNMIFSKVRGFANTDGKVLNRGVPTIICGENIKVSYLTTASPIIVPFETTVGPFQLELILET